MADQSATELQAEELEALQAIYGDDCEIIDTGTSHGHITVSVYIPSRTAWPRVVLRAALPPNYPLSDAPVPDLSAGYLSGEPASVTSPHLSGWQRGR